MISSKRLTLRHTVKNLKDKDKQNLESSNRQATSHIEGIHNTINIQFVIRNPGAQKAVG